MTRGWGDDMAVRFFPINDGSEFEIDLRGWSATGDGGGFGQTLASADDPRHVIKRLHATVPAAQSFRWRKARSEHSRAMAARLTEIAADTTSYYVRDHCLKLKASLSTHVAWNEEDEHVLLYQARAAGRPLGDMLLSVDPPNWPERLKMAKGFVGAMGAVGRTKVVHLDCDASNTFVDWDGVDPHVTLIDLDGCGIPNERSLGDSWRTAPDTLGKLTSGDWRPLWFPFDASWQTPVQGNFKAAECWCVLMEVWRILTWEQGGLFFWYDNFSFDDDPFSMVRGAFAEAVRANPSGDLYKTWAHAKAGVASWIRPEVRAASDAAFDVDWQGQYGLGNGSPEDDEVLSAMAAATVTGLLHPRDRSLPHSIRVTGPTTPAVWDGPPALPGWQWTQNRLNDLWGRP